MSGISKWRGPIADNFTIEHGSSGLLRAHTVSQARIPFHPSYNMFQQTARMLRPVQ